MRVRYRPDGWVPSGGGVISISGTTIGTSVDIGRPSGIAPTPFGNLRLDTRAGGAHSIQAVGVTDIASALSASGFSRFSNIASPYVVDFASDVDGAGTKAFRFNWRAGGISGFGGGCLSPANVNHVHTLGIEKAMTNVASGEVYLQYTVIHGKTSTGDGVGSVGSWEQWPQGCGSGGGKRFVWFRQNGSQDGRVFIGAGFSAVNAGHEIWFEPSYVVSQMTDTRHDPNNFIEQKVKYTFRIKPNSSQGVADGEYAVWVDSTKHHERTGVEIGHLPLSGFLQIGGPTWTTPSQDQTSYYYDIVVWQP